LENNKVASSVSFNVLRCSHEQGHAVGHQDGESPIKTIGQTKTLCATTHIEDFSSESKIWQVSKEIVREQWPQ
jgi:hypothetical protein